MARKRRNTADRISKVLTMRGGRKETESVEKRRLVQKGSKRENKK